MDRCERVRLYISLISHLVVSANWLPSAYNRQSTSSSHGRKRILLQVENIYSLLICLEEDSNMMKRY